MLSVPCKHHFYSLKFDNQPYMADASCLLPFIIGFVVQWQQQQQQQSWHGILRRGSGSSRGAGGRDEEVLPGVIFGGNNGSTSQVKESP